MSWMTNLRLLVFARRGVVALENIADILQSIYKDYHTDWEAKHAPRKAVRTEIGSLDATAAETRWIIELGNRYGLDVSTLSEAEINALIVEDRMASRSRSR